MQTETAPTDHSCNREDCGHFCQDVNGRPTREINLDGCDVEVRCYCPDHF